MRNHNDKPPKRNFQPPLRFSVVVSRRKKPRHFCVEWKVLINSFLPFFFEREIILKKNNRPSDFFCRLALSWSCFFSIKKKLVQLTARNEQFRCWISFPRSSLFFHFIPFWEERKKIWNDETDRFHFIATNVPGRKRKTKPIFLIVFYWSMKSQWGGGEFEKTFDNFFFRNFHWNITSSGASSETDRLHLKKKSFGF